MMETTLGADVVEGQQNPLSRRGSAILQTLRFALRRDPQRTKRGLRAVRSGIGSGLARLCPISRELPPTTHGAARIAHRVGAKDEV